MSRSLLFSAVAILLLGATSASPALAHQYDDGGSCGNSNASYGHGWNSGYGQNHNNWSGNNRWNNANYGNFGNYGNSLYSNSYYDQAYSPVNLGAFRNSRWSGNQFGFNNGNGYVNQSRGLFNEMQRLADQRARIQDRLNSGNLSADQAARLQSRLSRIQADQTALNSTLNSGLTSEQTRLQQLLSSGRLSPNRAAQVQERLNEIASLQSGIGNGSLNGTFLSGIRNFLGF